MADKVVLAYSGGLDTSAAITWLQENHKMDVITLTIDVGNERDFSAVKKKALKVGAIKAMVKDAKKQFVDHYVFPALQADAIYEGQYPLATALGRPLMARLLVEVAQAESCAVSSVESTRESLLPYYGAVGGRRLQGRANLYLIEDVIEKPTPTEAEQRLLVPGLRAGHYLCFFGMHVLTPTIMEILEAQVRQVGRRGGLFLSQALAELARRERYLALERQGWRYDVGVKYGLLAAQLALALSGKERDEVLSQLLELLARREQGAPEE